MVHCVYVLNCHLGWYPARIRCAASLSLTLFCLLGWRRKRRCCLLMEGRQPRAYFFSDEYYYTYFAFPVLHIQQKHSWLYYGRPMEQGRPLYFCLWLLLLSFFLLFFPRLISAVADWMPAILPHMVWPQCEFSRGSMLK